MLARSNKPISLLKLRKPNKRNYLVKRLRQLFNESLNLFELNTKEKPDTIFTSKQILNFIVTNKEQIITTNEETLNNIYYLGFRIVLVKTHIIVAALCSSEHVINEDINVINNTEYNLVDIIDNEYDKLEQEKV